MRYWWGGRVQERLLLGLEFEVCWHSTESGIVHNFSAYFPLVQLELLLLQNDYKLPENDLKEAHDDQRDTITTKTAK